NRMSLSVAHDLFWTDKRYAILIILQGMDTAGKDGTIKHVMSGVNPQGCRVESFGVPTRHELNYPFLWRFWTAIPRKGEIGIFNRSYYEDVLVPKVHPEILDEQRLPPGYGSRSFWDARFEDICAFEKHLTNNGVIILKFFLHISYEEQRDRLVSRLRNEEKHWKYSPSDLAEREHWPIYQKAYEEIFFKTSTPSAPWYIIPADYKWVARMLVADLIIYSIHQLDLRYPEVSNAQKKELATALAKLQKR
ncbi:MAG: polyphosphate kinase 2 family protein, partial [Methanocalculus sp.]|uniref:PPK2 family polyphosphate kinase n=1 Tax=Methanocalculus sp. TaxID=2004547 RepID=UPI0027197624